MKENFLLKKYETMVSDYLKIGVTSLYLSPGALLRKLYIFESRSSFKKVHTTLLGCLAKFKISIFCLKSRSEIKIKNKIKLISD